MKPLHLSRKAQIALLTLFFNATAVAVCEMLERPGLQPLVLQCVTALGVVLIGAFGAQDHGKEAALASELADRTISQYPDAGEGL